jgi:hypothetical protein
MKVGIFSGDLVCAFGTAPRWMSVFVNSMNLGTAESGRTFPYAAAPGRWVVRHRERQVSGRNRYYRNPLYEIALKDGRRPEAEVADFRLDVRN